jgi:PAS domain S-box-containing protein
MAVMTHANGADAFTVGGNNHALCAGASDASPQAQFVVDANGRLAIVNERARTSFELGTGDLGRPIQDQRRTAAAHRRPQSREQLPRIDPHGISQRRRRHRSRAARDLWNHRAEDLWGLRTDAVKGQNFLNLDIGFPTEQLRTAIRACLAGETDYSETTVMATNRRGRSIECRVAATPPFERDGRSVVRFF